MVTRRYTTWETINGDLRRKYGDRLDQIRQKHSLLVRYNISIFLIFNIVEIIQNKGGMVGEPSLQKIVW